MPKRPEHDGQAKQCVARGNFRDFFVFSTANFTGPVTSASLSLYSYSISGPITLRFGAAQASALYDTASPDTALYNALGSGTLYGSFNLDASDSSSTLTFTLNAAGIADLNSAIADHRDFAIAGSLATSSPTPEPASWALMLGGFGLVGGAMRRRKVALTFA